MDIALEAPPTAARALFRDACRGTHARLDQRLSQVNFNDRGVYAGMLSRMSAPLTALESALTAGIAPVLFTNWAGRLRAHALRADIDQLGASFHLRDAVPIESESEAFGALYVLEGSRLGGQVLARMAAGSADADVRAATRYFTHGARGGMWRSYLEALERSQAVKDDPDRATRAALAAFAAFESAFA